MPKLLQWTIVSAIIGAGPGLTRISPTKDPDKPGNNKATLSNYVKKNLTFGLLQKSTSCALFINFVGSSKSYWLW